MSIDTLRRERAAAPRQDVAAETPAGLPVPRFVPWLILALLPVIVALFLVLPTGSAVQAWVLVGSHVAIVACMGIGMRLHRPAGVAFWRLLLAGQVLYAVADAIFLLTPLWRPLPFPSTADILYVGSYLTTFAALAWLARLRSAGRDRSTLLDSAIVTLGLSAASYVFLVKPFLGAPGLEPLARLTSVTYPVMDILLFAVFVRVAFTWLRPTPALLGILGMLAIQLVSDIVYGTMQLHGAYSIGVIAGDLSSWWLLGAAVLHPSMRRLAEPEERASRSAPSRLWFLTTAAVLPPALIVMEAASSGLDTSEVVVLAALSIVVFLLVIARVHGLMVSELHLRAERAVQGERIHLMENMTRLMEQERAVTAAEIHDGPVQHLPSLALQLARVDLRLARGDLAGGREIAERVREGLEHEVADLRRLMAGLHPPMLEHGGLEAAVRDLGGALAARAGCSVSVDSELGERLAGETEFVLFRVAQEALANVAKHADAQTVRVRLGERPGWVELDVVDDGRGFQPTETGSADGRHFGLSAMRERIGAAGGILQVASRPGGGTTLSASVPTNGDVP